MGVFVCIFDCACVCVYVFDWRVCMCIGRILCNMVRTNLGLKSYQSFSELSSNTTTCALLSKHFDSIPEVDFYTGILVENTGTADQLGQTTILIIASLAYSVVPHLLSTIRSQFPACLQSELLNVRATGFLRHLLQANTRLRIPLVHTFRVVGTSEIGKLA